MNPTGSIFIRIIAHVTTVPLQDRRTDAVVRREPIIDDEQNWKLKAGSQIGGFTTLIFSRLLDTGDEIGDRIIGQVCHHKLSPH